MKIKSVILLIILIIILVSIFFYLSSSSIVKPISCDDINKNPPEMTFGLSYCLGNECREAQTKEECEKIDVVKENDISTWGEDGRPDCIWDENENPTFACKPNK